MNYIELKVSNQKTYIYRKASIIFTDLICTILKDLCLPRFTPLLPSQRRCSQLLSLPAAAQSLLPTPHVLVKGQHQARQFSSAGTLMFPDGGRVRDWASCGGAPWGRNARGGTGVGSQHFVPLGVDHPKTPDLISQAQQLFFRLLSSTLLTYSSFLSCSMCVRLCVCVSACTFVCSCVNLLSFSHRS